MTIVGLIVALVVISLVIWLVQTYIPQPAKMIVTVVLVLVVCVWLLSVSGILPDGPIFGHGKLGR